MRVNRLNFHCLVSYSLSNNDLYCSQLCSGCAIISIFSLLRRLCHRLSGLGTAGVIVGLKKSVCDESLERIKYACLMTV